MTRRETEYMLELADAFPERVSFRLYRYRVILHFRDQGQTFSEIAARYGVSPCRIRQWFYVGQYDASKFIRHRLTLT